MQISLFTFALLLQLPMSTLVLITHAVSYSIIVWYRQIEDSHFLSHPVCCLDFKTHIHLSRVMYLSNCIVSATAFKAHSPLSLVLVQKHLLCMFTALHSQLPPSSDTITIK